MDFEEFQIICDGLVVIMCNFLVDNSNYFSVEQLIIDYADSKYLKDSVPQESDIFATCENQPRSSVEI